MSLRAKYPSRPGSPESRVDLILWRHAEADEADGASSDLERRLTPRGWKQAKLAAAWLGRNLPKTRRVLVSPARRTLQTADTLQHAHEIEPRIGPDATAGDVLAVADWPNCAETVLIVGHQPILGRVAALLLAGREEEWSFRKGAVWWFSGRQRDGESQTVLRAVFNPDLC